MTNEIQRVRDAMEQAFDPTLIISSEHREEVSPCGRYLLVTDGFGTAADPTFPSIVVAEVRKVETGEVLVILRRNDDRLFYYWITRDGPDYFLFPEDLEGHSVTDLTDRRIEGYATRDGDFVWTEFHPSPDKAKLAVIGCYWACPYQVTVYDFRNPMNLPLPIIVMFDLPGNNAKFGEWHSNNSLTLIDTQGVVHTFAIPDAAA
jgi:hypothetical protein